MSTDGRPQPKIAVDPNGKKCSLTLPHIWSINCSSFSDSDFMKMSRYYLSPTSPALPAQLSEVRDCWNTFHFHIASWQKRNTRYVRRRQRQETRRTPRLGGVPPPFGCVVWADMRLRLRSGRRRLVADQIGEDSSIGTDYSSMIMMGDA